MMAYCEFRKSFEGDEADQRIIFYGFKQIIEEYLNKKWTIQDVEKSINFLETHNIGFTPYPKKNNENENTILDEIKFLFKLVIDEYDGYFPTKVSALKEGSVVYPHVPVFTIVAEKPFEKFISFWEPIFLQLWYPSTVATLSRKVKELIKSSFEKSVDEDFHFLLNRYFIKHFLYYLSRLHDFGYRGCTCLEQAIIGGSAHLVKSPFYLKSTCHK